MKKGLMLIFMILFLLLLATLCFAKENNGERFARVEKDFYDAKMTGEVTNRMTHYDFRKRYGKKIYEDVVFGITGENKCSFCGRKDVKPTSGKEIK